LVDCTKRKEALIQPYLYRSLSADFNDPFEFQNKILPLRTKGEILSYFKGRGSSDEELRKLVINLECGGTEVIKKWTTQINQRSMDVTQAKVRVCCFSKRYNSLLMWSHYSNKHQGYCLKFNTRKLGLNGALRKVIYRKKDKYPVVRPIDVAQGSMV